MEAGSAPRARLQTAGRRVGADTASTGALGRRHGLGERLLRPVVTLATWAYLSTLAGLCVWVLLGMSASWEPVTVTTGSMGSSLRPGDVLMVDEPRLELLAPGAVILFEAPSGELVTHRIEAVDDDGTLVTRGDANRSPDAGRVDPEDVRGVGRMIVPLIARPLVWMGDGDLAALAAFAVLTIGALILAVPWGEDRRCSDAG
jgi:signal peptidase I